MGYEWGKLQWDKTKKNVHVWMIYMVDRSKMVIFLGG
jgi:hypothetical protein